MQRKNTRAFVAYKLSKNGKYYIVEKTDNSKFLAGEIQIAYGQEVQIADTYRQKPVTKIGALAFCNTWALNHVRIANGVTDIERGAFSLCEQLQTAILPDTLITIADGAFFGCRSLKKIALPQSVKWLGEAAFVDCGFKSIIVAQNNKDYQSLDGNLYSKDGTRLIQYATAKTQTRFVVPDGVRVIEYGAFQNAKRLKEIVLPPSITDIGAWAFNGCDNLIKIHIPNGVKKIKEKTFENCKKLTEILLPNGVIAIENGAFQNCKSLVKIVMPNSVQSIGMHAFAFCDSLADVDYLGTESDWENINIQLINGALISATKRYVCNAK